MRTLFCGLLFSLVFCLPVQAQTDAELSKAQKSYEESVAKQKELLVSAFDRKLTDLKRAKDQPGFDSLDAEKEKFLNDGQLPESNEMKSFFQKYAKGVGQSSDRGLGFPLNAPCRSR